MWQFLSIYFLFSFLNDFSCSWYFFIKHEKDMMEIVKIILIIFEENQSACNYFFRVQWIEFFLIIDKIVNNEGLMEKEKKE